MMRRTTIALVNLTLCGLLLLSGCKSSKPMGLAEKTAPGAVSRRVRGLRTGGCVTGGNRR